MDIPPAEQEFFALQKGDLLVCEGGEVGRCAIWQGQRDYMAFQKALHRVRPGPSTTAGYLRYYFEYLAVTGGFMKLVTGSTIKHLPQQKLREVPVILPPLAEQHRIVEALEDHLSRLGAAVRDLEGVRRKIVSLRKAILLELVPAVPPESWAVVTTGEAGTIELGRQRHPDWHHGPEMRPYLRVANVFEDRIDTTDVKEMDFSGVFEKFRLLPGDVLLNEGQSPHLVGRPAIYRGDPPDVAFTNSLLRFRPREDVLPEWALLVFRRHMHAGRFMREARITTNIAHLSATRLATVEFPIPPLDEQKRLIARGEELMSGADAVERAAQHGLARSAHLRQSLLSAALSGRLAPQDPADEPAAAFLSRVGNATSSARAKRRRSTGTQPTPVPQELPL